MSKTCLFDFQLVINMMHRGSFLYPYYFSALNFLAVSDSELLVLIFLLLA